MSTPEQRMRMAKQIVDFEARRDKKGHLQVYKLPAWDGGGRYEVAGINEKYNKEVCDHLVELIEAGKYDKAEELATEFIASDTDVVVTWSKLPAIEFYLRDSVFNRGHAGGAKILQMALGVEPDGVVGSRTSAVLAVAEQILRSFSMTFAPSASATSVRWSGATSAASPGKDWSAVGTMR